MVGVVTLVRATVAMTLVMWHNGSLNRLKELFMVKFVLLVVFIWALALASFIAGRESIEEVKQIDKVCPEQKEKLITSSHSSNGTICVYQESHQRKGKIKRIEL